MDRALTARSTPSDRTHDEPSHFTAPSSAERLEPSGHRPFAPPLREPSAVAENVVEMLPRRRRSGVVLVVRVCAADPDQGNPPVAEGEGEVGVFAAVAFVRFMESSDALPSRHGHRERQ